MNDPYYVVREDIQESARHPRSLASMLGAGLALTRCGAAGEQAASRARAMRAPRGRQRRPRHARARAGTSATSAFQLPSAAARALFAAFTRRATAANRWASATAFSGRCAARALLLPAASSFACSRALVVGSWRSLSGRQRWPRATTPAFELRRPSWPADAAGTAPRVRRCGAALKFRNFSGPSAESLSARRWRR